MTTIPSMEPMVPSSDMELDDLVLDLVARSHGFASQVNAPLRVSLGDLVRSMNCYYSNLIEGHATHLVDIERAMVGDYSAEPERRNLQLEAKAHIEVQRMIDRGLMPSPEVSEDGIRWIHREFCSRLPESLLTMKDPSTGTLVRMVPGELRQYHVRVGRHEAPSPEALRHLMWRFAEAYNSRMLSRIQKIVSVASAHHRLAWIHPFMDGNGRVTRLLSHATMRQLGIGSELWSVSRGLARRVGDYKTLLQSADEPRRGDRDGRGALTESGLRSFCKFFLEVCIDQIEFMQSLIDPPQLLNRVEIWTEEEIRARRLPPGAWPLLREAIIVGEFPRSRATTLTGYAERQARTVLSRLLQEGILVSDTAKGPVRLGFPASVVERWLPGLYSSQPGMRTISRTGSGELPVATLRRLLVDRGWEIPPDFEEIIGIYADASAVAGMIGDIDDARCLRDLLDRQGVVLPSYDI